MRLQGKLLKSILRWLNNFNFIAGGLWDSVERLFYRDGNGAKLAPTAFEYEPYYNDEKSAFLTDHRIMKCTVKIDRTDYVRPETELKTETKKTSGERFLHSFEMVARCIGLIFTDLIRLYKVGKLF